MYYEEIKQFLKGKDPQFQNELDNILQDNDLQSPQQLQNNNNNNLPNINNNNTSNAMNADLQYNQNNDKQQLLLAKYKQTDAYKRLLKRQGQAVRRIERIKENFEKKRMQVNMISVDQKGLNNYSSNISNSNFTSSLKQSHQLNNCALVKDISSFDYQSNISNLKELDKNKSQDNIDQQYDENSIIAIDNQDYLNMQNQDINNRPHTQGRGRTGGLRSMLSSQTPLSYQVIMEERSSIASQHDKDKMDLRSHYDKMKGMQKVEPYMRTSLNYFKKLQRERHGSSSTTNRRQKSMINQLEIMQKDASINNNSMNQSQVYDKTHYSQKFGIQNFSPNSRAQQSFVTGINTYQNEIIRNRQLLKSEQRSYYKPSLANKSYNNNNINQHVPNSNRNHDKDNNNNNVVENSQSIMSYGFDSSTSSKLNHKKANIDQHNSRPSTTSNGQTKLINNNSSELNFSNKNKQVNKYSHINSHFKPSTSQPKRNNLLGRLQTHSKDKLPIQYSGSQNLLDDANTVREQDEEYQDSRFQSNQITINSNNNNNNNKNIEEQKNNNLKGNTKNEQSQQVKGSNKFIERKYNSLSKIFDNKNSVYTASKSTNKNYNINLNSTDMQKHYSHLIELNKSDIMFRQQQLEFKNPVQSYNYKKNQILSNIKSKQYWPEGMKKPEEYREFYWTPDMSFCGFTSQNNNNKIINNSGIQKQLHKSHQKQKKKQINNNTTSVLSQNQNNQNHNNINKQDDKLIIEEEQKSQIINDLTQQIQQDQDQNNNDKSINEDITEQIVVDQQ